MTKFVICRSVCKLEKNCLINPISYYCHSKQPMLVVCNQVWQLWLEGDRHRQVLNLSVISLLKQILSCNDVHYIIIYAFLQYLTNDGVKMPGSNEYPFLILLRAQGPSIKDVEMFEGGLKFQLCKTFRGQGLGKSGLKFNMGEGIYKMAKKLPTSFMGSPLHSFYGKIRI